MQDLKYYKHYEKELIIAKNSYKYWNPYQF